MMGVVEHLGNNLVATARVSRNLAIEQELFGWCCHPIQYRKRSDRMPALNHRSKSSCYYRVPHPVASLAVLY
jgi:hypothetical protein